MSPNIVAVSDIVIGYGSPQIMSFVHSIARKTDSQARIYQPFLAERPVAEKGDDIVDIQSVITKEHPHWPAGRYEYLYKIAQYINKTRPEILVLTNYNMFEVLSHLEYRPKRVIHLALEDLEHTLNNSRNYLLLARFRKHVSQIDLWVFPEENRAIHDAGILEIPGDRIVICYNVSEDNPDKTVKALPVAEQERLSKRIVYAGTLDKNLSVARYLFDDEFLDRPIDIYGDIQGPEDDRNEMLERLANKNLHGGSTRKSEGLRWFGQVPLDELNSKLPYYGFSIVFWLPVRHALINAAPNKFFQAVGAGVPVLTAPHPQCRQLVQRYGCGISLDGWEKSHLIDGIDLAEKYMNDNRYDEFKKNCQDATRKELNWSAQFAKVLNKLNI